MYDFSKNEKEILKFWEKNKIFEKTLTKKAPQGEFVFYDGPPFATGLPHYGHLVPGTIKDVVPRYFTMKGSHVERKWGWDCHGLPVEQEAEKILGVKRKNEIEAMGIEKFNQICRENVLRYTRAWEKTIKRTGRWVDFGNHYKTMDTSYIESVWWVFKKLFKKGFVYQDYRSAPYCPRCETPLSNFEVNQGYRDNVEDPSVYLRFKIKNQGKTSFLVWTTTPWTLPGNVALAVRGDVDYVKIDTGKEFLILAQAALQGLKLEGKIVEHYQGKNLLGLEYEPLFDFVKPDKKAYFVFDAKDLVSTEEGTGIVHIAPAYGEEDFKLGKENNLPLVVTIDSSGKMMSFTPWAGIFVKKADPLIIENLKERGLLFKEEKIRHTYPFCWRCEAPVYDYLWPAWFVKVEKIRTKLVKNNQKINWVPQHLKKGRFGKWLEGARDWNISRNRFWGAPLPVWICEKCGRKEVIGSLRELKEKSGSLPLNKKGEVDPHRPYIDEIKIKCSKCEGVMKRTTEVFDCWFESGSMPYASVHYPFENKKKFKNRFPADFIAEGMDQTRGWFYTLNVLSTLLFNRPAFLNVVVNGLILAEDGRKMSKSLKNYPEPKEILEKNGADALRFYLLSSRVVKGEDFNFSLKGLGEIDNLILTLFNIFEFYNLYQENFEFPRETPSKHLLDKWLLSRLNSLIVRLTKLMDAFDFPAVCREIALFINDFSTWYLRRSRERLKEKQKEALAVFSYTLYQLTKLLAPLFPFISEKIYLNLTQGKIKESVHLEDWPKADKKLIDKKLEAEMSLVRKVCELGHHLRQKSGIKVRQPLGKLKISAEGGSASGGKNQKLKIGEDLLDLIKDELNVKEVELVDQIEEKENWVKISEDGVEVFLGTEITPELRREGIMREIIRQINDLRKQAKLTIKNKIKVYYQTDAIEIKSILKDFSDKILESTASQDLIEEKTEEKFEDEQEIVIEQKKLRLAIKKNH